MSEAAAGPVTVESARALPSVVDETDPWFAALSPDGAHLAYYTEVGRGRDRTGQICLFTFDSAAKLCSDLSRDLFIGYPYQLQWSPDSSMVAFSENSLDDIGLKQVFLRDPNGVPIEINFRN